MCVFGNVMYEQLEPYVCIYDFILYMMAHKVKELPPHTMRWLEHAIWLHISCDVVVLVWCAKNIGFLMKEWNEMVAEWRGEDTWELFLDGHNLIFLGGHNLIFWVSITWFFWVTINSFSGDQKLIFLVDYKFIYFWVDINWFFWVTINSFFGWPKNSFIFGWSQLDFFGWP